MEESQPSREKSRHRAAPGPWGVTVPHQHTGVGPGSGSAGEAAGRAGSPHLGDMMEHSSGLGVAMQSGVRIINHFSF